MNIPPKYEDVVAQLEAALGREAALREELRKWKETAWRHSQDRDKIQQRLTVAEQIVQKMIDCSKGQDSIATGYLADILAALKPAEEVGGNG